MTYILRNKTFYYTINLFVLNSMLEHDDENILLKFS